MSDERWMIYGAYGYTGRLIAEEAVSRGHRPLLAGRSREKLRQMAKELGLDSITVDLSDRRALAEAVGQVDLVLHTAGPFGHTATPMVDACLERGVNYLDIGGSMDVFASIYARHDEALQRNIVLMPGGGFDVVPTDCICRYVADKVPDAVQLDLASHPVTTPSGGTLKSMIEELRQGGRVRRNGKVVAYPLGKGARHVSFTHGEETVVPIPAAEVESAYRTTGIPNITVYSTVPGVPPWLIRIVSPLLKTYLSSDAVRGWLGRRIAKMVSGPDEGVRERGKAYLWAKAADGQGNSAEAWMETIEAYRLTSISAVLLVEHILRGRPTGALTPAGAFGADFTLEIPGVHRFDALPPTG